MSPIRQILPCCRARRVRGQPGTIGTLTKSPIASRRLMGTSNIRYWKTFWRPVHSSIAALLVRSLLLPGAILQILRFLHCPRERLLLPPRCSQSRQTTSTPDERERYLGWQGYHRNRPSDRGQPVI